MATAKALKHHAGPDRPNASAADNLKAIEEGSANLERHILNAKEFGVPCVVAANRFPGDTDDEVALVQKLGLEYGAHAAVLNEGFTEGGAGAAEMAEAVADAADQPNSFNFMYEDSDPIDVKIEKIAKRIYRADGVDFLPGRTAEDRAVHPRRAHRPLDLHGQDPPLAVGRRVAGQRAHRLPHPRAGHPARTPAPGS